MATKSVLSASRVLLALLLWSGISAGAARQHSQPLHLRGKDLVTEPLHRSVEEATTSPTPSPATTAPTPSPPGTSAPTASPTVEATSAPTASPTVQATSAPTASPTVEATSAPTTSPTASPTVEATSAPTTSPTASPTVEATSAPTASPTVEATLSPTVEATPSPTVEATPSPTVEVTPSPTPATPTTPAPTVAATTDESLITASDANAASSADEKDKNSCFSGQDTVLLRDGQMKLMGDLQVGDEIQTLSHAGILEFSPVIFLPHAGNQDEHTFIEISTEDGQTLRMTSDHLVASPDCRATSSLVSGADVSGLLVTASRLKANTSCLLVNSGDNQVKVSRIVSTRKIKEKGIYTAVTQNPFIVVGGVVASPFAVSHQLPHAFYAILRVAYSISPALMQYSATKSLVSSASVLASAAIYTVS